MVVSCSAYGCTNRAKKGGNVSFHGFPSDPAMRKKWIIATKRQNFTPSNFSKLCSEHFLPEDFFQNFGKKTVKSGVVPSIFNFPQHLSRKECKKRSERLQRSEVLSENIYNVDLMKNENSIETPTIPLTPSDKEVVAIDSGNRREFQRVYAGVSLPKDTENLSFKGLITNNEIHISDCESILATPSTSCVIPPFSNENVTEKVTDMRKRKRSEPVYLGDFLPEDIENPKKFKKMWQMASEKIHKQKKTIKYLRTKVYRLQTTVKSLNDLMLFLKSSKKISSNCHLMLQECLPNSQKQLLLRQLKQTSDKKFPPELRAFALTLHFYSSSAYGYVRKSFNNCLPHPRTLRKWYSTVDGSPGYTSESLHALKMKVEELKKEGKELVCSLIVDEMAIRQYVQWNGQRNIGYVDFGVDVDSDSLPLAKEALVFLVVGVNCRWKIPIAYFLISSLTAQERANLVKGCLIMLQKCGVKTISLTFDGAAANLAMTPFLGTDLIVSTMKTHFLYPGIQDEVFIILDPCHVIKLIRNALGDWNCIYDGNGGIIKWQYFQDLVDLQEKEQLHLATKIRRRHLNYNAEKMKVKLAVQVFSSSVADALDYCRMDLKLKAFENSSATSYFCQTIDKLFDILNTRNSLSKNFYKKPLSITNINFIRTFFQDTRQYILNLKDVNGEKMVHSKRKTGFLGLLVNMNSVQAIVEKYIIQKNYLSYLLTYKLSQDHIETFFCAIRSKGGFNNNPTAVQFEAAYKRLPVHAEITASSAANCLPQDDTYILQVSSATKKNNFKGNSVDSLILEDDFEYDGLEINEVKEYCNDVIGYICGFIVKKLKKQVQCQQCCLQLDQNESVSKLVCRKDRGGLIKPSKDIVRICQIAESVFRKCLTFHGNVILKLKLEAKKHIDINTTFLNLSDHILDQDPLNHHLLQLINLILEHYFKIRLHHKNMTLNEVKTRIRHKLGKLILFKHQ